MSHHTDDLTGTVMCGTVGGLSVPVCNVTLPGEPMFGLLLSKGVAVNPRFPDRTVVLTVAFGSGDRESRSVLLNPMEAAAFARRLAEVALEEAQRQGLTQAEGRA